MLQRLTRLDGREAVTPDAAGHAGFIHAAIGLIGTASFESGVLSAINGALPAVEWSAYGVQRGTRPVLQAAACVGRDEVLHDIWARYSTSLHYTEAVFSEVWAARAPVSTWMLHGRAAELPKRHREELFDPQRLRGRLSWVRRQADQLWTLNLYRDETQPEFEARDAAWLHAVGGLLLACLAKHAQWRRPPDPWGQLCGSMPLRERQVCSRLLKGWTHEGIAADLGLSARTVKTYRDRAFARLGIHHRQQLFDRVRGGDAPGVERPLG